MGSKNYGVEIPIGAVLLIDEEPCIVKEGRTCKKCAIRQMTAGRLNLYGGSMQCGTRENGNTSDFLCAKDVRTDKKYVYFAKV